MQIGVLATEDSWAYKDLQRAAGDDFRLVSLDFTALQHSLASSQARLAYGCSALLVRTMPAGSLEQIIFRMDLLSSWEQQGLLCINAPKAMETAIDKFLTSVRLRQFGLATPLTWCGQRAVDALKAFDELGGDVVVKPLFGSRGRGLMRIQHRELGERTFQILEQMGSVLYLQRYAPHGDSDYRALVLGEHVYTMRRTHPLDWRKNACRGALCEAANLPNAAILLARQAAKAVGAVFAGVDLIHADDGTWQVLEVNASPSWRALSRTLQVDVARALLEYMASGAKTRKIV